MVDKRKPKLNIIFSFLALAGFVFLANGCDQLQTKSLIKSKSPKPKGTIIAKVNDLYVTQEQLETEIKTYNEMVKDNPEAKIDSLEKKIAYLNEEIIRRYLFYKEAKDTGADKNPQIRQTLKQVEINLLAADFIQEKINNITATPSEIENFYNLYKDQYYKETEKRKIREIALPTETKAKEVLIELLGGGNFANLARQYSQAKSAYNGGVLNLMEKGQRGGNYKRFDEVAFSPSLRKNQISNIFKGDDNLYYIIKVENIEEKKIKALSKVWDEINKNVIFLKQQQKLQELTAELLKKADIEIYKERVK